jgi:Mrp family chromosome partitioning ATPase
MLQSKAQKYRTFGNDEIMLDTVLSRKSWLVHLATALRFLLRWGWFLLLCIVATTLTSLLLPDPPPVATYQASLQVQVILPTGHNSLVGTATSTSFYAGLFMSPATISLLLPQYPGQSVSDLQPLILATPVTGTAIVQLSAQGDSAADASKLVNAVYQAAVQEIQTKQSKMTNNLTLILTAELAQSKQDAQDSAIRLQNMTTAHQTDTYAYMEEQSLYREELQRVNAVNQSLLALDQQDFGHVGILRLLDTTPAITTTTQIISTQHQRMMLSPLVGLLMGLGGVLLADTFSTRLPLRGKKRERILPGIVATLPVLPGLRSRRLQMLQQTSPCTALFRHLRYQASEHETPLSIITVTSAKKREGKSLVATALALAAAQSGLRTLLIDANPQHPILHCWFQLPNMQGLLNTIEPTEQNNMLLPPVMRTPYPKVSLLPIGTSTTSKNPLAEALPIASLRALRKHILAQAEIVIFDGPPLLSDANAAHLVQIADLTLLVVDAHHSQSTWIIEAENLLSTLGAPSAIVLNRADADSVA